MARLGTEVRDFDGRLDARRSAAVTTHVSRDSATQDGEDTTLDRLLVAMEDLREGNFRRRIVAQGDGRPARLAAAFNEIAERNQLLVNELLRVRDSVATEGVLHERLRTVGDPGGWGIATGVVNELIDHLTK